MINDELLGRISDHGVKCLSDEELLSILIGKTQARRLLKHIDGYMTGLEMLSLEELSLNPEFDGMSEEKAARLLAAVEIGKRSRYQRVDRHPVFSPKDIYRHFSEEMANYSQEHFKAIYLDSHSKIIRADEISIGTLSKTVVGPRDVFIRAINLNASYIVLLHNHPSGESFPSEDDISLTGRLMECGDMLGITVLDHMIIGGDDYQSLNELGFMEDLKKNGYHLPA